MSCRIILLSLLLVGGWFQSGPVKVWLIGDSTMAEIDLACLPWGKMPHAKSI